MGEDHVRFGDFSVVDVTKAQVRVQAEAVRMREAVRRMHFHERVVGEGAPGWMSHSHDNDDPDHVHPGRQARPARAGGGYWEELGPSQGSATPPTVAANLVRVAESMLRREPTPGRDLMRWRLRLFCGHEVERTAHRSHLTARAAFVPGRACVVCGLDPATVVAAEPLGLVDPPEPPSVPMSRPTDRRRLELESAVAALRVRMSELERELAELERST